MNQIELYNLLLLEHKNVLLCYNYNRVNFAANGQHTFITWTVSKKNFCLFDVKGRCPTFFPSDFQLP